VTQKFGTPAGTVNGQAVNLRLVGGVLVGTATSDNADPAAGINVQRVLAEMGLLNVPAGTWERWRTPTKITSLTVFNIGATNIVTPTAGKKFRLFGYLLMLPGNASLAAAAVENMDLKDGGSFLFGADVFVPNAAGTGPMLYTGAWVMLNGNGYLSAIANNTLQLNLGTGLATSAARISVLTSEE
jgi:hypothetical protein